MASLLSSHVAPNFFIIIDCLNNEVIAFDKGLIDHSRATTINLDLEEYFMKFRVQ